MARLSAAKHTAPEHVLFIVPRYHTNMIPMVEAFVGSGVRVSMICTKQEIVEDHLYVKPHYIKPEEQNPATVSEILDRFKPNLIIIREELAACFAKLLTASHLNRIQIVYYSQRPYRQRCSAGKRIKSIFSFFTARRLAHSLMITPVYGNKSDSKNFATRFFKYPFSVDNTELCRPYFKNDQVNILLVGKLAQPRKRHDWVLNAIHDSKIPISLVITGAGNDLSFDDGTRSLSYYLGLKQRCKDEVAHPRVNITLCENVPYGEMADLYLNSDIFVLPSRDEPFAISPLEAMARGCCVLAPRENGSSCYITEGSDGFLFDDNSYLDFSTKLCTLISNRPRVISTGRAAVKTVAANHGYDQFINFVGSL